MSQRAATRRCRKAAYLAALVLVGATGCTEAVSTQPAPGPTRAAAFTKCAEVSLSQAPSGFSLAARELEALRGNHMGEVVTYRSGTRTIQLYSGPDLYDSLEDLDLTSERVTTTSRSFALSSTRLAPELLIAVLQDKRLEEPCDNVGVLTRHVPRATMVEVLERLQVTHTE